MFLHSLQLGVVALTLTTAINGIVDRNFTGLAVVAGMDGVRATLCSSLALTASSTIHFAYPCNHGR